MPDALFEFIGVALQLGVEPCLLDGNGEFGADLARDVQILGGKGGGPGCGEVERADEFAPDNHRYVDIGAHALTPQDRDGRRRVLKSNRVVNHVDFVAGELVNRKLSERNPGPDPDPGLAAYVDRKDSTHPGRLVEERNRRPLAVEQSAGPAEHRPGDCLKVAGRQNLVVNLPHQFQSVGIATHRVLRPLPLGNVADHHLDRGRALIGGGD